MNRALNWALKKGRVEEKRALIERLLAKKFGALPKDTLNKIQNMDGVVLAILSFEILDFQSVDDLFNFIHKMSP